MPADISIEGADEFQRVARQLRDVADKELRRDLYRGIERAVKPLKERAKDSARRRLPRSGGLAEKVAKSKFKTRKSAGRDPGIRLEASGTIDVAALDRGQLRHPVFGHRAVWVEQKVEAGWFSDAMESGADEVRSHLLDVLDDVKRRLANG